MKKLHLLVLLTIAFFGILDAGYLTYEYFANIIPPCTTGLAFVDCGRVLRSQYATVFGVPMSLLGLIHYSLLSSLILLTLKYNQSLFRFGILFLTKLGLIVSIVLMYIQFFVIKSLCLYCIFSALFSLILFILAVIFFEHERKAIVIYKIGFLYRNILKRVLFMFDPEAVHNFMVGNGVFFGKITFLKKLFDFSLKYYSPMLKQTVAGIVFKSPIGLSAGFDYEGQLTQILPHIGFGFQAIGSITYAPYEGNPPPRLGRLPKSKSLMVNKGLKSSGAKNIIHRITRQKHQYPLSISVAKTNSRQTASEEEGTQDYVKTFELLKKSGVGDMYELNISCPNAYGGEPFTTPEKLKKLLHAILSIHLSKPVFIKMPVDLSEKETDELCKVAQEYKFVTGLIIGNLTKDRQNPYLDPEEAHKFKVGNFSGKPTEERSNNLIKFVYKKYKKRFVIIGCGGVFGAKDAYKKIKLGATLIELITGMIYQGPQLPSQINLELTHLLKNDGYSHISEAIGIDNS